MAGRRTTREFLGRDVPRESLENILDAATLSPSGADKLPFAIIVVKEPATKQSIRDGAEAGELAYHGSLTGELKEWFVKKGISHEKPFLTDAPVLLVIAADTKKPYAKESAWLSISYMLLAIEAEGLGTVTYTPSETGFINPLLKLPDDFVLEVILPLGYAAGETVPKKPRPAGRVFDETYGSRLAFGRSY